MTEIELAAFHEAGHAVIGHLRGQCVRDRGLAVNADGTGHAHVQNDFIVPSIAYAPGKRAMVDRSLCMSLAYHVAGYVAETKAEGCLGPCIDRWWRSDDYVKAANDWQRFVAPHVPGTKEMRRVLIDAERLARSLFRRRGAWEAECALAQALMRDGGSVSGDEARAILSAHLPGSYLSTGERVPRSRKKTGSGPWQSRWLPVGFVEQEWRYDPP